MYYNDEKTGLKIHLNVNDEDICKKETQKIIKNFLETFSKYYEKELKILVRQNKICCKDCKDCKYCNNRSCTLRKGLTLPAPFDYCFRFEIEEDEDGDVRFDYDYNGIRCKDCSWYVDNDCRFTYVTDDNIY